MTDTENKIMDHLADAWNLFITLPTQHPDDVNEFRTKLHDLQRSVMAREAVRTYPEKFAVTHLFPECNHQWIYDGYQAVGGYRCMACGQRKSDCEHRWVYKAAVSHDGYLCALCNQWKSSAE